VSDNGSYKIRDVIVAGVSMAVTQRSEFTSIVQRNAGQLRGLLAPDAGKDRQCSTLGQKTR